LLTRFRRAWQVLFPVQRLGTPEAYAARTLELREHQARVAALRSAAAATADEQRLKEFRDIANARVSDEAARQTSIIARAQGLFVALALFGLLFTFGAGLFTQTAHVERWILFVCLVIVVYMLSQIALMIISILEAISGINYLAIGTSDLTQWLGLPSNAEFYRAQALLTLDQYRAAALNNSWRFQHLGCALKSLRNIVFALSILILFLFIVAVGTPRPPMAVQPAIVSIPPAEHCWHRHLWYR